MNVHMTRITGTDPLDVEGYTPREPAVGRHFWIVGANGERTLTGEVQALDRFEGGVRFVDDEGAVYLATVRS